MVEPVSTGAAAASGVAALFGGITIFFIVIWAFVIIALLVGLLLIAWALYSILTSKNKDDWKLLWSLIVVFAGWIGVVLYYFIGKKERIAK